MASGEAAPAATMQRSSAAASDSWAQRRTVAPLASSARCSSPAAHFDGADEATGSVGSIAMATRGVAPEARPDAEIPRAAVPRKRRRLTGIDVMSGDYFRVIFRFEKCASVPGPIQSATAPFD